MPQAAPAQALDHGSLDEIMIRWKLAELLVADLAVKDLPWDHALRLVIRRDVPRLLQELLRLRPDLA
ncbi:MAG: hypothetical protein ACR2IV_09710 [Bryobacteraceae bacterium]